MIVSDHYCLISLCLIYTLVFETNDQKHMYLRFKNGTTVLWCFPVLFSIHRTEVVVYHPHSKILFFLCLNGISCVSFCNPCLCRVLSTFLLSITKLLWPMQVTTQVSHKLIVEWHISFLRSVSLAHWVRLKGILSASQVLKCMCSYFSFPKPAVARHADHWQYSLLVRALTQKAQTLCSTSFTA